MIPSNTLGPGRTVLSYGKPQPARVLSVYADLRCPYCRRMENGLGRLMEQAADEDLFGIEYHFGTLIDDSMGGSGSLTAIGALGAAADEGPLEFIRYLHVLYGNQPSEQDDAFADPEYLLRLASEVDGLRNGRFDAKVLDAVYLPWAGQVSAEFAAGPVQSTPTVLLDGQPLPVLNEMGYPVTPEMFRAMVAE